MFRPLFFLGCILMFTLPMKSFSQEAEAEGEGENESEETFKLTQPSVFLVNRFGSYGFFDNGIKGLVSVPSYKIDFGYSYHNSDGYRQHSLDYGNTASIGLESLSETSGFWFRADFKNGKTLFPGSLTESEFNSDPYKADKRSVDRDEKSFYTKGNLEIGFSTLFGKNKNNKIEIIPYTRLESYERATREYRIINKFRAGVKASFENTSEIFSRNNIFTVDGNVNVQPGRTEYYENFGGIRNDEMDQLMSQKSGMEEIFVSDKYEILKQKLDLKLTAGYRNDFYHVAEQTLPSRSEKETFHAFTPIIELQYHPEKDLTVYGSFGYIFTAPEDWQLDSPYPEFLFNKNLKDQLSQNITFGVKGDLIEEDSSAFVNKIEIDGKYVHENISNEIMSYEIFGDYFFRNADKTKHDGITASAEIGFLKNLFINARYSWSDFRYEAFKTTSYETDSTGNLNIYDRDFSGKKIPGIPAHLFSIDAGYDFHPVKILDVFLKAGYRYSSKCYGDDANNYTIPAFGIINSAGGVKLKMKHFECSLSGEVQNITDKVYVGYVNVNSADRRYFSAGAPRSFFLNIDIGYIF